MFTDIPIIINNYNRLSTTRKLYKDLTNLGYNNIIILDNASTYLPLLDWYMSLKSKPNLKIEMFDTNYGNKCLWKSGYINKLKNHSYVVYTESDIELNPNIPKTFVETLIKLSKEFKFDKVGLSINIKDLPKNEMTSSIKQIEEVYWIKKIPHRKYEIYQGMIDSSLAVFDPNIPFNYNALRVAGNFTSNHIPWYTNFNSLSKEELYFLENATEEFSIYKQNYLKWMHKN